MNKVISVTMFRVSSDSKFLDVIIDCPRDYHFVSFELTAKYTLDQEEKEDVFNIGGEVFTEKRSHWVIRIDLSKDLNINVPAMYSAKFEAMETFTSKIMTCLPDNPGEHTLYWIKDPESERYTEYLYRGCTWIQTDIAEEGDDVLNHYCGEADDYAEVITDEAVSSDINCVYGSLMDDVIATEGRCSGISEDLIRNYIILFAHQEAMRLGYMEDAWLYFKMLVKGFSLCGSGCGSRTPGHYSSSGCNTCSGSTPKYEKKSSCNCGRK